MSSTLRPVAAITGASTGLGFELARCCAEHGYDLLITADEPRIYEAAHELRGLGVRVGVLQTDLATRAGVERFYAAAQGRPIEALLINAKCESGSAFLDQQFDEVRRVLETNIGGTAYLLHRVAFDMRVRGRGKVLLTGATADVLPGTSRAVYDGATAFIAAFGAALREELQNHGITVTCLLPGAHEASTFDDGGLEGSRVRASSVGDLGAVARAAFASMQNGDAAVVGEWKTTPQSAALTVTH